MTPNESRDPMTRTVVIGDGGDELQRVIAALAGTTGIEVVRHLSGRRPVGALVAQLAPDLTIIQEPVWSPLPTALIREARRAAPSAPLVVRAADATPDWVADAMIAGATTVLPATVGTEALGRVVLKLIAECDTDLEAARLRWAA